MQLILCASFSAVSLSSQTVKPDDSSTAADEKNIPVATATGEQRSDDVVEMSPFTVEATKTTGYAATRTMSGTRLNAKLEDLASSISVVTKEQLIDTASVDLNDIFMYEANTEGTHQFASLEYVAASGGGTDVLVDKNATQKNSANRIRGMGTANTSFAGFELSAGIGVDTYNTTSIEISRGPNSNMFGLGGSAGSVNIVPITPNLTRLQVGAKFTANNYGGTRLEGIVNVPIIKNVLAVNFLGATEEKGFKRKPAFDETNRYTVGATYRPRIFKHLKTTIHASLENFNNRAALPNTVTPKDYVTPWIEGGKVTWDPVTQTLHKADGTVAVAGVAYNQLLAKLYRASATANGPLYGVRNQNDGFTNNATQWIDNGAIEMYQMGRITQPTNTASSPSPWGSFNAGGTSGYGFYLETGKAFSAKQDILWKPAGISNQALYDWEHVNVQAANYASRQAKTYYATLEQELIKSERHTLIVQGAYFRQDMEGNTRDVIGGTKGMAPALMIDINERLLDGSPNPYYMRPYMAGTALQSFWNMDDAETVRGTIYYKLDFTKNNGWSKWLGSHAFSPYAERRDRTFATLGFYDYITSQSNSSNGYPYGWLGGSKTVEASRPSLRYYMGDNQGYNIDYAPQRLRAPNGTYSLRWYDPGRTANASTGVTALPAQGWVNEDVTIETLHNSSQLKRQIRTTMGIVWQGSFWDNRIVPTFGYRKDKLVDWAGPTITQVNGYPNLSSLWEWDRPNYTPIKSIADGPTKTAGIVVKPLGWLSFHYNQSDSFSVEVPKYDVYGKVIGQPKGEGKDYGVSVSLFRGKLNIRYNQYEVTEENARTPGNTETLANRLYRIDFSTNRGTTNTNTYPDAVDRWHLEASAYRWVMSNHGIVDKDTLTADQREQYRKEAWDTYITPQTGLSQDVRTWFTQAEPKPGLADSNTAAGRGREIEFTYNPDRYLTIRGSITQQKAYDSGVSVANTEWAKTRVAVWQNITIPTNYKMWDGTAWVANPVAGMPWWTTADSSIGQTVVPKDWYDTNVDAPMTLINATAGQKKPQQREWNVTASARYRLAGLHTDNFLKNIDIGGTLNWGSKVAIGYLAAEPDKDGVIRKYNPNGIVYRGGEWHASIWLRYNFKLLDNKIRGSFQINVRDLLENGGLEPVTVNPDGTPRDYRIVDPRFISVSTTFDF